jgi:hypothetical protein
MENPTGNLTARQLAVHSAAGSVYAAAIVHLIVGVFQQFGVTIDAGYSGDMLIVLTPLCAYLQHRFMKDDANG